MTGEGMSLPKPLVEVNGETLMGRLIRIFSENDAESIHVMINGYSPRVEEFLAESAVPVQIVKKTTPSSLHSFFELIQSGLQGPVCLTTVDTVFNPRELRELVSTFRSNPELDGLMAVTSFVDDESPLYVRTDGLNRITGFEDQFSEGIRLVSGGIYCLRQPALEVAVDAVNRGVNRMRNYQRNLLGAGLQLRAFEFKQIVDVDHIADIKVAESLLSQI